jgi:hypothetical protein
MNKERINEQIKLAADFLKSLSASVAVTGVIAPAIAGYLDNSFNNIDLESLGIIAALSTLISLYLFILSLRVLDQWLE